MPANLDNAPPASAATQAAMPRNRGERRAQAALARKQTPPPEARAPPFSFDLANLPPLLRISDICRDPKRGYPGILPMTRSAFLTAVEDGYIPKGLKLGAKVIAWKSEDIARIAREGVKGRRVLAREAREAQHRAGGETANP